VKESFADDKTALNLAKTLNTAISSNKLEISDAKRDIGTKTDVAKAKFGNQEIILEAESSTVGVSQPKVFFDGIIKEKSVILNTPVRILPSWVSGRPALGSTRPAGTPAVEPPTALKEDETLRLISQTVLQKKLPELRAGIDQILNESKVTSLRLSVESEKLRQLKPENVSTIKFTLVGNDFTMVQDEGQKSIL
jgi:hypothetical protein